MGLEERFREHRDSIEGVKKMGLATAPDEDGDIALLSVSQDGEVKVLGWLRDEECAREFKAAMMSMANGKCDVKPSDEEMEEAVERWAKGQ